MTSETVADPSVGSGRVRRRTIYGRVFAGLMYVATLVYFAQSVLIGEYLSGNYEALRWHGIGGTAADGLLFCAVVAGALVRWEGKGKTWPFVVAVLFLLSNQAQNGAGAGRLLWLHIPLGVAMIATIIALAVVLHRAGGPARRRSAGFEDFTAGGHAPSGSAVTPNDP